MMESKYVCTSCNLDFKNKKSNYERHINSDRHRAICGLPYIHAQYICEMCGKRYLNKYNLARHQKQMCPRQEWDYRNFDLVNYLCEVEDIKPTPSPTVAPSSLTPSSFSSALPSSSSPVPSELVSLQSPRWLDDRVIDSYFRLIMERSMSPSLPSVYTFSVYFYPKLVVGGQVAVKRWTKETDVFSHDLLLIPIHLGNHWCLVIIDSRTKTITYYDSLMGENPTCLAALREYMEDESMDKRGYPFDFDGWLDCTQKNIPKQTNAYDCGVFACMYAEYKSRNAEITFTEEGMPQFREQMKRQLVNQSLL